MTAPIRVVVVDDQPLERTGNALILDSDDGLEALALVSATEPEIVLMDVRMPRMNGIDATGIIAKEHPRTRVIALTTFDLDEYAFGSLRAGASAFLLKSTRPEALVEAVKTVAAGDAVAAPRLTTGLIAHFLGTDGAPAPAPGTSAAGIEALSPRERDVFSAIVRGLTSSEIGEEFHLARSTVKSHVNSIFAKLGLRDRVHAVIHGYEIGLRHE